jgi:hypothetical protein
MREGEEQAHSYRLYLRLFHGGDGGFQARTIERRQLSVRPHPFLYGEAQPTRDEGGRAVLRQVVERGPVLACYLQDVPETFRRHECRPCAAALQQGVQTTIGDGRSVLAAWDWRGGKLTFSDEAQSYNLVFSAYVKAPFIYNSQLVSGADFKSWKDLLEPKWQGKIALEEHFAGKLAAFSDFL